MDCTGSERTCTDDSARFAQGAPAGHIAWVSTQQLDARGVRVFSRWWTVDIPVGVVIVVHSIAEHSGRYHELAELFNRAGFTVMAPDLRGHGQTSDATRRGLGRLRGGRAIIDGAHLLRNAATEVAGEVPVFVVGHSAGSLVELAYLVSHSAGIGGAVLCAVPDGVSDLGSVARALQSASDVGLRDERVTGQLGDFNAAYEPARTAFDWMSRDDVEVDSTSRIRSVVMSIRSPSGT